MVKRNVLAMMFFLATLASVGSAQAKNQYGQAIPNDVKVVKLKDILGHPAEYQNKEVVLEGNYGGYCCASDFLYKEGVDGVEIYPQGFPTPKLIIGKPIKIYGIVRAIDKKTESQEEGKEEEHHEIYIEAKGVKAK